jgi:hypothetical protein
MAAAVNDRIKGGGGAAQFAEHHKHGFAVQHQITGMMILDDPPGHGPGAAVEGETQHRIIGEHVAGVSRGHPLRFGQRIAPVRVFIHMHVEAAHSAAGGDGANGRGDWTTVYARIISPAR